MFEQEKIKTASEKLKVKPGICIPWKDKMKEIPKISGDTELFKKVWEDNEALAYMYIWQCLLSF